MSWIKRNLFFLIGSLVAVGLMAGAGFYLFQKTQYNNKAKEDLNNQYAELKRLYNLKPHPGNDEVDNIKEANKQQEQLRELLGRASKRFESIQAIPSKPKVTGEDFTALLRQTIDQLQKDAAQASVTLPPKYDFTFQAIKPRVNFAPGSLPLLAAQLGEVKAVCDILFRAKINALENLRRERVSSDDDPSAAAADYLEQKSNTNELAVLVPYEISFRCFSSELAAVLDGFRQSPHGFIVKTVRVEAAPALAAAGPSAAGMADPGSRPDTITRRYGLEGVPSPGTTPGVGVATSRGGLPIVINEKLLRVSLLVNVVKLLPKATSQP